MRVAALGFSLESNTFSRVRATFDRFKTGGLIYGDEITRLHRAGHSSMSGFIAASERAGVELVPLFYSFPSPMGAMTVDAFEALWVIADRMLRDQGPFEAVLLAQHGAAVSDDYPDADGEFIRRVRLLVGPAIPVGVACDLHANLTPAMVDNSTVLTLYHTNPHIDAAERAAKAAELTIDAARGLIDPLQRLIGIPAAVSCIRQRTTDEPLRSLIASAISAAQGAVLDVSVGVGHVYADVVEMGLSVLVISDGDAEAAHETAVSIARQTWAARAEFQGFAVRVDDAFDQPVVDGDGPIVLLDIGDNVGGGSPGDSTILLASALDRGIRDLLCPIVDPEAVQAAVTVGVGNIIEVDLGAKTDTLHGQPVRLRAKVLSVHDLRYSEPGATHAGFIQFNAGPTVVLDPGGNNAIVVHSYPVMSSSLEQFRACGIDPRKYRYVIAKGVFSPRPAYEPIAGGFVLVDTPGITTSDIRRLHYENRRRPMEPFETDTMFDV